MQDPNTMTLSQLREMAMTLGISNFATLKKKEALEAIFAIISPGEKSEEKKPAAKKPEEKKVVTKKAASEKSEKEPTIKKTEGTVKTEKTKTGKSKTEKPVEGKSKTEKPVEGKSKTEKPVEEKTKTEKPVEGKSKTEKPVESKTTETKAAIKKATKKPAEKTSIKKVLSDKKDANRKLAEEQKSKNKKEKTEKKIVPLDDEYTENNILDDVDPEELARAEAEAKRAIAKAEAAQYGVELPAGIDSISELDSGETAMGILEIMQEGYGFLRGDTYMPGEKDIYISPGQIKRWQFRTGDYIEGPIRTKTGNERYLALLYPTKINYCPPEEATTFKRFESLTPIFPNERIHLERGTEPVSMRAMDLFAPVGKGQRGMIVSPPKAGKTTLIKDVALSVLANHPEMKIIILLIDERPEEVTDIKESIVGPNVEVAYSTFDELPEHHKRIAEMVLNRAKRLVEHGEDVMILLDSITRLSRAYNLVVAPSGRTLSGGLDPSALYMPKKFFGSARNMREGGSLTILATALIDTGSRMDDVIFEEFKGTGNMEIVLDRKLSEKRIFPAIDILKSGTRKDELILTKDEVDGIGSLRRASANLKPEEATEKIVDLLFHTRTNQAFLNFASKKIL